MNIGHGLSPTFLNALKHDPDLGLHRFTEVVKRDHTLCLEIRENYINIYYRGGNLIRLSENNGKFSAFFDRNYLPKVNSKVPTIISKQEFVSFDDVTIWVDAIPFIKQEMDYWFSSRPKNEREFQQLMVRENNFGGAAKSTDYFICDIEYSNERRRFDLIAARWPSSGPDRKNNKNIGLAFIELKYMNKSMANTSGICSHITSMEKYYQNNNKDNFAVLKEEMRTVFNQKIELKLIKNQKCIESFDNCEPEFIMAFANHDPDSSILIHELEKVETMKLPFKLKFAVSNFMGYGLYKQNIFGLEKFMTRFEKQIYSKQSNSY